MSIKNLRISYSKLFSVEVKPAIRWHQRLGPRKLLVLSMGILIWHSLQGQAFFGYGAAGFATQHDKSFSNYIDNFNKMKAAELKRLLSGFKPGFSYSWGLGISTIMDDDNKGEAIKEVSIFANNSFAKTTARYSNGQNRVYDLARHYAGIESAIGFRLNERSGMLFSTGLQMGRTILDCYFVYQDGTESHGRELRWNGIFSGYNIGSFLGAKYFYKLGDHFCTFAKLSYNFDFSKKNALWDGDNEYPKQRGIPLYPEKDFDVGGSVFGGGSSYGGPWVRNRFDGLALQFGLSFYIPE